MRYDDTLVGSLAILFSIVATAIAIGPWSTPYQLRTIGAIKDRFGKSAARGVWFAVALAAFAAGITILSGARPSYARPASSSVAPRSSVSPAH
ncbi:hypothetical protein CA13_47920 [Planctomycetes bacterium CA13]|uniref:Uncharacterized protein n=1 Tax=Novipirellula herctigrandis TaxID=2527986 RepID=A0A5C5Z896_9BACT|nr:hypothetical protein CA13_47920 [Planctomycetes bacterium CA13]